VNAQVIPVLPLDALTVRPWPEPVLDQLGHDPRSHYVETFWLSILGPSTTWLLRRMVGGFDEPGCAEGYDLDLAETARCLGLGERRSRHSPFTRALIRLVQFDVARLQGDRVLAVRRKLAPLNRWQVDRLPVSLQRAHRELQDADLVVDTDTHMRQRAERLALSLLDLGEDVAATERQLLRWNFHPALAREAAAWATAHRAARRDGVA
jgi:hypothetical protein